MKKYIVNIVFVLLCCSIMGCSQTGKVEEQETGLVWDPIELNWEENGFAVSESVENVQKFWPADYVSWDHDLANNNYYEAFYGDSIYILLEESEESGRKWFLEQYDGTGMECSRQEISSVQLGIESQSSFIVGLDVIGQEDFVFQVVELAWGNNDQLIQCHNDLIYWNADSGVTDRVDLAAFYETQHIDCDVFPLEDDCHCDGNGMIYIQDRENNTLYVLDKKGEVQINQCFSKSGECEIGKPLQCADGEVMIPVYDQTNRTTKVYRVDTEHKSLCMLADMKGDYIKQLYAMENATVYYENNDGIIQWNVSDGRRELIYSFDENGVSTLYKTILLLRDGQTPLLRMYGNVNNVTEDWVVVLSRDAVEKEDAVRIVDLDSFQNRNSISVIKNCAAVVSRRNPVFTYEYESFREEGQEDRLNLVVADIVSGKGPDMLYVSREDMALLAHKGVLANLGKFIPEETKESLLPGVLELGTIDGTLVGITPDIHFETMVTTDAVWLKDTWTVDDILALTEKNSDLEGVFSYIGQGGMFSSQMLYFLVCNNLENSEWIDWEDNVSYFDSDKFVRVLDVVQQYSITESDRGMDDVQEIRDGHYLAEYNWIGSYAFFEDIYQRFGDDCRLVGIPSEKNCGNYLSSDGFLVVTKCAENSEAVSAYFEYLLSKEQQYSSMCSVLKIDPDDIYEDEYAHKFYCKGLNYGSLYVKEDGETALHDFKRFTESCVPKPMGHEEIENILYEELDYLIYGDKSASEVARSIDNRVQLYLDENNM